MLIVRTLRTQGNCHTYREQCQRSKRFQISRFWSIGLSNLRTEILIQEHRKMEYLLSPGRTLWTQTTCPIPLHSIWASTLHLQLLTSTNHLLITTFIKTDNCLLTSITTNGPVSRTSWSLQKRRKFVIGWRSWTHLLLATMSMFKQLIISKKQRKTLNHWWRRLIQEQKLRKLHKTKRRTKLASRKWRKCTVCSSRWRKKRVPRGSLRQVQWRKKWIMAHKNTTKRPTTCLIMQHSMASSQGSGKNRST